jgi:hypothetical protein
MLKLVPLLLFFLAVPLRPPVPQGPSVGNYIWNDLNRNGIQDSGEPGINGAIVKAFNATNNALLDTQSTKNDGVLDGTYQFAFRVPVTVYLVVEPPIGFAFTLAHQGGNESLDSDVDPLSGRTQNISLDCSTPTNCFQMQWDVGLVRKLFEKPPKP